MSHRLFVRPVTRRRAAVALALCIAALAPACLPAPPPGTSHSPSGHIDEVSSVWDHGVVGRPPLHVVVRGWASDWDTDTPIQVMVLLVSRDGSTRWSGPFPADQPRPDVVAAFHHGANSGFDIFASFLDPPPDTNGLRVCVSALNVGRGDNTLLGCRPVPPQTWNPGPYCTNQSPQGCIGTLGFTALGGTTLRSYIMTVDSAGTRHVETADCGPTDSGGTARCPLHLAGWIFQGAPEVHIFTFAHPELYAPGGSTSAVASNTTCSPPKADGQIC